MGRTIKLGLKREERNVGCMRIDKEIVVSLIESVQNNVFLMTIPSRRYTNNFLS